MAEPRTATTDLTKLRIERNDAPSGGIVPLVLAFLLGAAAGGGGVYFLAPRGAGGEAAGASGTVAARPVSTASGAPASVTSAAQPAPTPGAALLSASGYIIARREAEVGAKIPGRL